jgi:hypothetical protein
MRWARVRVSVLAIFAVALLAGCGPVADGVSSAAPQSSSTPVGAAVTSTKAASTSTVPNVVGKRLSDAETVLRAAGLKSISPVDDTGRHRIVIDPENWVVDAQSPKAGAHASGTVTLQVRRPSDAKPGSTKVGVVPNVVCMNLQDAQNTMQDSGFFNLGSADGAGQGRMHILDRDWVVIGQSVRAGTKPGLTKRIVLTSVKYGESTGSSGCKS